MGQGSLIASGLNHDAAKGRPEGQWLLARLVQYAATMPRPRAEIPVELLRRRMPPQPPPGPYLCGSREAHRPAGRNQQPGSPTARMTPSSTFAGRPSRAMSSSGRPTLRPQFREAAVTFRFSGGLGYASQPKTKGFPLSLDGREVLRLDLGGPRSWASADGRVVLMLLALRDLPEDRVGQFYSTVSRETVRTAVGAPAAWRSDHWAAAAGVGLA